MSKKVTTEDFIRRAKEIHGDKYDYSKVDYKCSREKVIISCRKHGDFLQTPNSHLGGTGCMKCANELTGDRCRMTTEDFIRKSRELHGDKYDYSKVKYRGNKFSVTIICPEHGEFNQAPLSHYNIGCGCPKCKGSRISASKTRTTKDFVNLAKLIHPNYDYSKVNYINSVTKVEIICPCHGSFFQDPANHLQGKGCPLCSESNLEKEISKLLTDNNLDFEAQKTWDWLIYKSKQTVDFYLPKYNIAIECQGEQHFIPVKFFGGDKGLIQTKLRDQNKLGLCAEHGIKILYYSNLRKDFEYPYDVITDSQTLIDEIKKIDLTNQSID